MKKFATALVALTNLAPLSAQAHAVLETKHAQSKATYKAVIGVTHGCEDEATLKVQVTVPESFVAVKPMPKAGWTVETTRGKYEKTYEFHGPRAEGVKEIVWTGMLEWNEIPQKGHGGHHSEFPAPALTISGEKQEHH